MLLATTYSCCRLKGLEWFLDTMKNHSSNEEAKKNSADHSKEIADKSHPIHDVWDLALIAYSAYG